MMVDTPSAEPSVTRCAPGARTPKDQIKFREKPPEAETKAHGILKFARDNGLSHQAALSKRGRDERDKIMSVAMSQPHRVGVSPYPDDAWMATALGRFCRIHWNDRDTQRSYWWYGERYAQLVDNDRIARGETPRQCAAGETGGSPLTLEEARERRDEAGDALAAAEDAMREVDNRAPRVLKELAWHDREIPAELFARVYHALYKLSVHFERLDANVRRKRANSRSA